MTSETTVIKRRRRSQAEKLAECFARNEALKARKAARKAARATAATGDAAQTDATATADAALVHSRSRIVAAVAARAAAATANDTFMDEPSSPPTNLYTEEELRLAAEASALYDQLKEEEGRHRDWWLKKIGPALVIARAGALKVANTTNVHSQAYRDAIPGELKRLNLTKIKQWERSYCLKIMDDDLPAIEKWLSERVNPDRLNHPKPIWNAWTDRKYVKWEDDREGEGEYAFNYWGEEPESEPTKPTTCRNCGTTQSNKLVASWYSNRKDEDGKLYSLCPECHAANPEPKPTKPDKPTKPGDYQAKPTKPTKPTEPEPDNAGDDDEPTIKSMLMEVSAELKDVLLHAKRAVEKYDAVESIIRKGEGVITDALVNDCVEIINISSNLQNRINKQRTHRARTEPDPDTVDDNERQTLVDRIFAANSELRQAETQIQKLEQDLQVAQSHIKELEEERNRSIGNDLDQWHTLLTGDDAASKRCKPKPAAARQNASSG